MKVDIDSLSPKEKNDLSGFDKTMRMKLLYTLFRTATSALKLSERQQKKLELFIIPALQEEFDIRGDLGDYLNNEKLRILIDRWEILEDNTWDLPGHYVDKSSTGKGSFWDNF